MPLVHRLITGATVALLAVPALAHHVWIEMDNASSATLYFGEFGANLRETSPGLLDKFVKPHAFKQTPEGRVTIDLNKTPRGYTMATRLKPGQALIAEEASYPISERKQGEQTVRSLYQPAARLVADTTPQPPALTLDIVPTGRQGQQGLTTLQAFYKGQPLPKAKVTVITASGWVQEHHAGDDGSFQVRLPWRGTYVFELSHSDTSGGERDGQRFDRATYVTSLTLVQHKGLAPLPAAPVAPPNPAR